MNHCEHFSTKRANASWAAGRSNVFVHCIPNEAELNACKTSSSLAPEFLPSPRANNDCKTLWAISASSQTPILRRIASYSFCLTRNSAAWRSRAFTRSNSDSLRVLASAPFVLLYICIVAILTSGVGRAGIGVTCTAGAGAGFSNETTKGSWPVFHAAFRATLNSSLRWLISSRVGKRLFPCSSRWKISSMALRPEVIHLISIRFGPAILRTRRSRSSLSSRPVTDSTSVRTTE
mmetsp:Transcript_29673/g.47797  ORF Transcript_29673/g.47797 Transcript_29673/m.47797 type:complete len:234 (+) Transcript_29673:500-1201(+)